MKGEHLDRLALILVISSHNQIHLDEALPLPKQVPSVVLHQPSTMPSHVLAISPCAFARFGDLPTVAESHGAG